MATTVTSSSISFLSFTGLKLSGPPTATRSIITAKPPAVSVSKILTIKASLKKASSVAAIAAAASMIVAGNVMAMEVLLGTDDGGLAFVPNNATVASGEKIVFKNNAGFPHNVIFDEDEVPGGVDATKISMNEEDLLNGPGETYEVTLTVKGTYGFYCAPHQGAGMTGKITVN